MLGVEIEGGRDVPELQVQVHNHHAHRRNLAQPDGNVGGNGGLADSAFGGEYADDQALVGFGGGLRCRHAVPASERLSYALQEDPDLRSIGVGESMSRIPARMA